MCSAVQEWCWFADAQKSSFQAANHSDMGNAVMKGLRFADTQELCFEAWKLCIMLVQPFYVVNLLILTNRVFRLRNVQIWVVLSWKVVVRLIFTNSVFKLQNFQIWNVYNYKWVYLLIVRNGIFRSRNVRLLQYHPARGSICWSSRVVFTGWKR